MSRLIVIVNLRFHSILQFFICVIINALNHILNVYLQIINGKFLLHKELLSEVLAHVNDVSYVVSENHECFGDFAVHSGSDYFTVGVDEYHDNDALFIGDACLDFHFAWDDACVIAFKPYSLEWSAQMSAMAACHESLHQFVMYRHDYVRNYEIKILTYYLALVVTEQITNDWIS